ncbi:flagellin N-terminal helical domain-containing protein [Paenibacillus sp. An7]|uniref:flagellin N-terminal helical domain-containing protein n=1 Tax=Paenibacillus sp. An7 TaxID=2689577 RepID=UPI00135784B5|nr:flagellin [Paenibacillus sp. An7]
MIINHNIAALNTHRQLSTNTANTSKNIEKLSSGLRINRAGDDAAGLAISEKMRGQIRGLDMASKNGQDGISMIQTAEGALSETHSILQRMRELAVQSGNDTNTAGDRNEIQKEVDQLSQEITRISNNTEFNTQNLLNGGITSGGTGEVKFQIGANASQNLGINIKAMDASTLGVARSVTTPTIASSTDVTKAELGPVVGTGAVAGATLTLSAAVGAANTSWGVNSGGATGLTLTSTAQSSEYNDYKLVTTASATAGTVTSSIDATNKTITINFGTDIDTVDATAAQVQSALDASGIKLTAAGATTALTPSAGAAATTAGLAADEVRLTLADGAGAGNVPDESIIVKSNATTASFTDATKFKGVNLTLDGSLTGATAAVINLTQTNSTAATFTNGVKTADATVAGGIDVSSQAKANTAITAINTAIETVSAERSKLGAVQNRLEHTINNLNTSSENLTAAESRVRDVDMAKEMMEQTKNNILAQAAQAMLAQANQQPQGVLQLLR